MTQSKSIILIGATGHIGSWVHRQLVEEGFLVTACARQQRALPPELELKTNWINLDLHDSDSVRAAFNSRHHDAFIHLASQKVIGNAENDPGQTIETNVCGTAHILAAASENGVKAGVFSSSWAVYKDSIGEKYAYKEEDFLDPSSVYGVTKKIGEELCLSYVKSGRIPKLTILRLFNTVGAPAYDGAEEQAGFFHYAAKAAKDGLPVTLLGTDFPTEDGTCLRDFVDVKEVAEVITRLTKEPRAGIFNIGSGEAVSLEEVVKVFEKISGRSINRQRADRRPSDPVYVRADISKARMELGFAPRRSLEDKVTSSLGL